MNDLSNVVLREHKTRSCKPIPSAATYILVALFAIGLSASIFILVVVHNAFFLLSILFLFALVASFVAWNTLNWKHKPAAFHFLQSFPDSDLAAAREGQLVKITGKWYDIGVSCMCLNMIISPYYYYLLPVTGRSITLLSLMVQLASCGSVSLESSYEKAARCIYASTVLYEYRGFGPKQSTVNTSCFQWRLAYCERFSTDFCITDQKSGIRAMVKAGSGCRVIPLIAESQLVATTSQSRILSPYFRKWLEERNLSLEARLLRLEEGYVQEGSFVTVLGMLHRNSENNEILMIVQPQELVSTGCLWRKLFLPVDIDGLVLGIPDKIGPFMNPITSNT